MQRTLSHRIDMVYSVGRDEAALQLGLSTRTVDRYIRRGKIRSKKVGKLIMLHRDDVEILLNGGLQQDYEVIAPDDSNAQVALVQTSTIVESDIMRILTKEMKEKDERISELSYKLGKLESELKNSIPSIEYRKATLLLEEAKNKRVEEAHQLKDTNTFLEHKLDRERRISTFFIIATLLICLALFGFMYKYFELSKLIGA